ncbi:MAG: DMT family transporter [Proteobacteria bacterium]|nr:DMT family transporter [Pseudomonadota bacterium]
MAGRGARCGPARLSSPPHLLKGLAWTGLAILCWGPMFSVAKRTLPIVDAFALSSIRYVIGCTLFLAILAMVEGRAALRYGTRLVPAIVFGLIGFAGFNSFVWVGLSMTRPEHASIIMAIQTPLTALVVWLARGQRPATFTLGCIVVAIAGVLLVVTRGNPAIALAELGAGGELFGDLLILGGALCWVAYSFGGPVFAGWSPLRFTALTCVPGAIGLVMFNVVAVQLGIAAVPDAAALSEAALPLAYFAIGTVVLGVLGFNNGVKHLGPLNTMLMLNIIPVSVFAIEASLGRSFQLVELAGGAIVIGALVANNLYLRTRRPPGA